MRRMYVASIRKERNVPNAIWSCTFLSSTPCNLITRVLTICHLKLTQITALEQKRLDLRSLSPVLRNLWLLLVYIRRFSVYLSYFFILLFLLYLVLNTHFINCIICKYAIQSSGYKVLVIYRSIYLLSCIVKLYSKNVFKRLTYRLSCSNCQNCKLNVTFTLALAIKGGWQIKEREPFQFWEWA